MTQPFLIPTYDGQLVNLAAFERIYSAGPPPEDVIHGSTPDLKAWAPLYGRRSGTGQIVFLGYVQKAKLVELGIRAKLED